MISQILANEREFNLDQTQKWIYVLIIVFDNFFIIQILVSLPFLIN